MGTDKIWMRKSDAQLGYSYVGWMGRVWFYGEWSDYDAICERTPCIFINDPRDKHGLHTDADFEDLGFAASKLERQRES